MKKLVWAINVLVLVAVLMCGTAMAATSGRAGSNVSWTLDDEGTLTLSGEGDMRDNPLSSLPSRLRGSIKNAVIEEGITSIGASAFYECTNLVSVSISQSVTKIGEGAFQGSGIQTIDIPQSVTQICEWAFQDSGIQTIDIPQSVTMIGLNAFDGCSKLVNVSITPGATEIWPGAFHNCPGLKDEDGFVIVDSILFQYFGTAENATVPESVVRIDVNAFENNTQVRQIVLPDSVIDIFSSAFKGCSRLESINIPDGVTYIGPNAFEDCGSLKSITIPNGVTSIEGSVFNNCTSLTSVTLPDTLTQIRYNAFYGCSALTDLTVPASVETIEGQAFGGCMGLSKDNMVIFNGILFDCFAEDSEIIIPDTVTTVDLWAFRGENTNTESILFPDNISTVISKSTYLNEKIKFIANLNSLTAQTLCKAGKSIWSPGEHYSVRFLYTDDIQTGTELVKVDSDVTDFIFPEEITSIAWGAFTDCNHITSISLPDDITNIADGAFWDRGYTSSDMMMLYCSRGSSTALALGKVGYPFRESDWNYSIVYLNGNLENVDLFYVDKDITTFSIPEYVTSIGRSFYPFRGCGLLQRVIIPDSVTYVGDNAFEGCSTISEIVTGDNVKFIGRRAFKGCSGLTTMNLPYGVQSIDQNAFEDCTNLKTINIPDSVTSLGNEVFLNCSGLTSLTLKNASISIGSNAFSGCTNLTITGYANSTAETYSSNNDIPFTVLPDIVQTGACGTDARWSLDEEGLLRIYGKGQMDNSSLFPKTDVKSVLIEDGIISIGNSAFNGFSNLKNVVIGDSVTTIGENAFSSCYGLTDITVGSAVTTILNRAFSSCTKLSTINLPDNLEIIGEAAFRSCTNLQSVNFGSHSIDIGENAFGGCTKLATNETIVVPIGTTYSRSASFPSFPSGITPVNAVYDGIWYRVIDSVYMGKGYSGKDGCVEETMMAVVGCDSDTASITIRESVLDMPVRAIAEYAFTGGTDKGSADDASGTIKGSLIIPDSIEYIGYNAAFRVVGITSISFGSNVRMIGAHAFNEMNYVSTEQDPLVIPASMEYIGSFAFNSPKCESIVIQGEALEIENCAFFGNVCKLITLNGSMQLGFSAFGYCNSLTNIIINSSAGAIEGLGTAFESNSKFVSFNVTGDGSNYSVVDGVLYNGDKTELIRYPIGKAGDYSMPESVGSIADGAFYGCSALTKIVIPDSVTSIGATGFASCKELSSIVFEGEAPNIDNSAFQSVIADVSYQYSSSWNGKALNYGGTLTWCRPTASCGSDASWILDNDETLCIDGSGSIISATWEDFSDSIKNLIVSGEIAEVEGDILTTMPNLTCIIFEGGAVLLHDQALADISAVAYYPHNEITWTEEKCRSYGGTITWTMYCTHEGIIVNTQFSGEYIEEAKPASCTTEGTIAHWRCSECGGLFYNEELTEIIAEQALVIPAAGHVLITVEGLPATCTETGLTDKIYCEVCGEIVQTQEKIAPLGHTETIIEALAPTCTEDGYTEKHVCEICGENLADYKVLPAIGHEWGEPEYTWSGDTVTASHVCVHDNRHIESETVTAIKEAAISPTEIEEGAYDYVAAFEDEAYDVQRTSGGVIPALNNLTLPTFPKSLTTIEEEAFESTPFQAIIIPDTVISIGHRAFANCQNLIYVYVPSSIIEISSDAFADCIDVIIDRAVE